jgi:sec-independent protein translocase protein TatA
MVGMPQGFEWVIILIVLVLLFGAKKLPELARGSGRALRIFKAETKGLVDDDEQDPRPIEGPRSSRPTTPEPRPTGDRSEQPRPDGER